MITKEELYPLPDLGVKPHLVNNFFPEEMFTDVKKHISKTGMGTEKGEYHPMMGRYASGIKLSDEIEKFA